MMTNKITGFKILFSIQLLLVSVGMFVDVKIGLYSMVCFILFSIITLIQLSEDKETNWKAGMNLMLFLFFIWLFYYIAEFFNPNNVTAAWTTFITPQALIPIICAFLVPLVIRNTKDIESLLFIWSVFIIITALKGYWQKNQGFSERELHFLYSSGGYRTHLIWSGIRYFSCFSDAANYGVHSAMAAVVFSVSAFFVKEKWKCIYFIMIAICAIYGIGISGTRSAMGVVVGGLLFITVIAKNWKALIAGTLASLVIFCFFYFTDIGNSNRYIFKMRSSFHPLEDASYLIRVENRTKMKELMAKKPFGYGVGLSKAGNYAPKEVMPYPPDSWLVSVWVETGIVGLLLYLLINGILFIWCTWTLMFKVRHKRLRGLVAAWLCMAAGFFVAAYVNDIMQYPNQLPLYTAFALCFAAPHIDKQMSKEDEEKQTLLKTEKE